MHKILFTGSTFTEEEIKKLQEQDLEIIPAPSDMSEEKLISDLQECEAVIVNGKEFYTEKILKSCKKLKCIQFFGIDYKKCIDVEVANTYGILVANTPKVNSYSVAEFTLGLLLALNQKIVSHYENIKKEKWEVLPFYDLKGKTIGILGMGHIGTYFSEIMYNAFHVNILYYDKEEKKEPEEKYKAQKVSLEKLLEKSDVVSIHLPLTEETKNLIGEKELRKMKKEAYLINTARAEIVSYTSLYNALEHNVIAGCAFDGFYEEPIDVSKEEANLLKLPKEKFLLTPHTGYNAKEGTKRVEKMCVDNLVKILNNEECANIVNKK